MTKISTASQEHVVIFCPGCSKRRPENPDELRSEIGLNYVPCCNPKCQGEWGTGCYHCHHPKYWPHPLFRVEAVLQGKRGAKRQITSHLRAPPSDPEKAVFLFTKKLSKMLLVEAGLKWRISLYDKNELWIQDYDHYAKGATIFHILVSAETTKPMMSEKEAEKHAAEQAEAKSKQTGTDPKEEPVTDEPKQTPVPDSKPKLETRMSRAAALEALRTYVSQQVEYETIDIIQMIVSELAANPGGHQEPYRRITVQIGQVPLDNKYNDVLEHAQALELGHLVPPTWLSRFDKLIAEIRAEFNLHEPVATPMPGEPPTNV